MLKETVSRDAKIIREMKDTIERFSMELISAKQSEQMFRALRSHSSSLEDQIEELRVENTKLRVASQILEEEKRQTEMKLREKMELLYLETVQHKIY